MSSFIYVTPQDENKRPEIFFVYLSATDFLRKQNEFTYKMVSFEIFVNCVTYRPQDKVSKTRFSALNPCAIVLKVNEDEVNDYHIRKTAHFP